MVRFDDRCDPGGGSGYKAATDERRRDRDRQRDADGNGDGL